MDINILTTSVIFHDIEEFNTLCPDLDELFKTCKQHAVINHVAMCNLAYMYETGVGTDKSLENAFYWYKRSADLGNAIAMYNIGVYYLTDIFLKKNVLKAFEWFTESAKMNNALAMYELGIMYYDGIGVTKNDDLSFEWLNKSINLGNTDAMILLGYFNFYKNNYSDGCKCFIQSIDSGNDETFYAMSKLYLQCRQESIVDTIMKYYDSRPKAREEIKRIFTDNTNIFVLNWINANKCK
jgi:TPR repeat protein